MNGQPFARKIGLSGEDPQLALRLQGVDRLVDPLGTPEMIARNLAHLAGEPPIWQAACTSLAVRNTPDRWEQVVEEYERLVQEAGDSLVPTTTASIQGRRLGHQGLARLPPSLLTAYQRRVDVSAQKLFEEGKVNRDPVPLRRLVDELFCSGWTEQALDMLGDLAFERGRFAEARSWWSLMVRPLNAPDAEGGLVVPNPRSAPALIRAKRILALAFLGQDQEAELELRAFRENHTGAEGKIAGQTGKLADIVAILLQKTREQDLHADESWTTFGGGVSRQSVSRRPPSPRLWVDGPTWRVTLPGDGHSAPPPRLGHLAQPLFHPLIVGNQVILADHRAVLAYDLRSGKNLWQYDLKHAGHEQPGQADRVGAAPHFTLSASGERLYVRLGRHTIRPERQDTGASYLICLDLSGRHGAVPRELWHVQASAPLHFEGAPLIMEDQVYIAQTKVVGLRAQTSLACFDAATGRQRWLQEVCDNPEFEDGGQPRGQHHLLTLAGGQLVYCSHAGVVVAVEPWSGRRLWALRYPSRGQHASSALVQRGQAACIFNLDRLYLAPLDGDRLICLDPSAGTILWERTSMDVTHLLGATVKRLYFTTSSGLQAVHAAKGTDEGGWLQPSLGKLPSLGRGLLAGGWIFWPTQDALLPYRALSRLDGAQESAGGPFYEPTQLRGLLPGNMVFARGCLVVAGAHELAGYVPP